MTIFGIIRLHQKFLIHYQNFLIIYQKILIFHQKTTDCGCDQGFVTSLVVSDTLSEFSDFISENYDISSEKL